MLNKKARYKNICIVWLELCEKYKLGEKDIKEV